MVIVRRLYMVLCLFCGFGSHAIAQQVYYPADASTLLQSVAADFASLLQQSTGKSVAAIPYTTAMPDSGFVLQYLSNNPTAFQQCSTKARQPNLIVFAAAGDNNLHFGVYQYLQQLGFMFYLPGKNWEKIPLLHSPFLPVDTVYSSAWQYKSWFISGGYNTWAMDSNRSYYWDTYFGNNGHSWAQYQRRNSMTGHRRFAGHRDDVMAASFLQTLQQQPCFVAPYNQSRVATGFSVPDVSNRLAMEAWAAAIGGLQQQFKQTVFQNPVLYANHFRNYQYNRQHIGLEVPDGARWANSIAAAGCTNAAPLPAADQHFTLANHSARQLSVAFPEARFQLYAYDSHADVPLAALPISQRIDVQVVAGVYQNITSPAALLKRWYKRHPAVSEYHYLNLAQWSGETAAFNLQEMLQTLQRIKANNSQGIIWEAGAGKFTCLPFLYAANTQLQTGAPVLQSLQKFCNDMFGKAAPNVLQLLQAWGNETTTTTANGAQDNRYKLGYYFQLLNAALVAAQQEDALVKSRLGELKAMLHYCRLYYQWAFSEQPVTMRQNDAAALCRFLAQTNNLQLVNSYAIINSIVNRFAASSNFFMLYNTANGQAYEGLAPLTQQQIDALYAADNASIDAMDYSFTPLPQIAAQLQQDAQLAPQPAIQYLMNYTQAKDYASQSVVHFVAQQAGRVEIVLKNTYHDAAKGYINIAIETTDGQLVIADTNLPGGQVDTKLHLQVPVAGYYCITISSKYKVASQVGISSANMMFFRKGPFLGNTIENYRSHIASLPGYFYVPQNVRRVYFSINNSNPGGKGFASVTAINKAFQFKDALGNAVSAQLANVVDSALFYLEVPASQQGKFWQASNMEQYRLCFANISNYQWYAQQKNCPAAQFDIQVNATDCSITAIAKNQVLSNSWQVLSAGILQQYNNQKSIALPSGTPPNTVIILVTAEGCSYSTQLRNHPQFVTAIQVCNAAASAGSQPLMVSLYPNPGAGIFHIRLSGQVAVVEKVQLFCTDGRLAAQFNSCSTFNISTLPAGNYYYRLFINGQLYKGQLQKY
jgi:hypothetical protein